MGLVRACDLWREVSGILVGWENDGRGRVDAGTRGAVMDDSTYTHKGGDNEDGMEGGQPPINGLGGMPDRHWSQHEGS